MKEFIIKGMVLLALAFIVATGLSYCIDHGLRKSSYKNYKEWNDIVNSRINADLVILGSSRALFHFSPKIIDSKFKLNSYNLGLSGWEFDMQNCRFQLYMKYNKKPKYVIQNIDDNTLIKQVNLFEYDQFLPYLTENVVRNTVIKYNGLDWRDLYIPLYKYHGKWYSALEGIKSNIYDFDFDNGKYKGFISNDLRWDPTALNEFIKRRPMGYSAKINLEIKTEFEQFIESCNRDSIKIFFVWGPRYFRGQKLLLNKDSILKVFAKYSDKYNIPLLDYSNDSICLDSTNFYNSSHLNAKGVEIFNSKLVIDLGRFIK